MLVKITTPIPNIR